LFQNNVFNHFSGFIRKLVESNQEIGFSPRPCACQKSPLPPFIKEGLGGISETGWQIKISFQISRYCTLMAHIDLSGTFGTKPTFHKGGKGEHERRTEKEGNRGD
jgi:hypothetical protein